MHRVFLATNVKKMGHTYSNSVNGPILSLHHGLPLVRQRTRQEKLHIHQEKPNSLFGR